MTHNLQVTYATDTKLAKLDALSDSVFTWEADRHKLWVAVLAPYSLYIALTATTMLIVSGMTA